MLRIKLVKIGKRDRPTWKIVVVEKTKTGKGRVSDYIGSYNPHKKPKEFKLDVEKYEKWVKNGAQPTDAVIRLKGKLMDKNKEYQKEVKAKVYKKKKTEESKKEAPKKEKKGEEIKPARNASHSDAGGEEIQEGNLGKEIESEKLEKETKKEKEAEKVK